MDIAERYILLAHALDAHYEGFIDGYGGPAHLAVNTKQEPAKLLSEAEALLAELDSMSDPTRREWLRVQVRAMHTLSRLLLGEQLPYEQEVQLLFDINPPETDISALEAGLERLETLLSGTGPLAERLEILRAKVTVPKNDILRVAQPILAELKRRAAARFGLPQGEGFSIGLVNDKPWSGYNWPLGNLQSRIDINTDLPVLLPSLPDLLAHEGYPGHHTEHATKEALLVRERGWLEHSIQLINAPECVVSEGIAVNALGAVMSCEEEQQWLCGELAAATGIRPDDLQTYFDAKDAQSNMKGVSGAAALMLWRDKRPEAEVLAFLERYTTATEKRARQSLRFIQNPTFRAYIFTYSVGGKLVKNYLQAREAESSSKIDLATDLTTHPTPGPDVNSAAFGELLRLPLTPGQLRTAGKR